METARELFEHELRDMYDAEKKLVRALQKMAKEVTDPTLSRAFQDHRDVTETQVERLEKAFEVTGKKARRHTCAGINGLIEEFSNFLEEDPSDEVLNLFSTEAALKVEHYEIVAYESLIHLASKVGLDEAASLFQQSLAEEQEAAEQLKAKSEELGGRIPVG